jgi:hypothetical protein
MFFLFESIYFYMIYSIINIKKYMKLSIQLLIIFDSNNLIAEVIRYKYIKNSYIWCVNNILFLIYFYFK